MPDGDAADKTKGYANARLKVRRGKQRDALQWAQNAAGSWAMIEMRDMIHLADICRESKFATS